jgi:DNA invertase Pin-like site-specific DNA recombinase
MVPAVIYAAKSTPDEKGSTADQIAQVRKRLDEIGGREVVGKPFDEENVSAYHGNRGPELEAAITAAIAAADEHGEAELWVFHSSRLARGSGKKAEGRSLLRIYVDLLERDVAIRSVENDSAFQHGAMVAITSDSDHQYSEALSSHVKRGKRDAAEAGRWPGGVAPDGYRREEYIDADGKARHRMVIDDERAPIVRRIFQMATSGHSSHAIARQLNREGIKTRPSSQYPEGKLWTNQRVHRLLGNSAYCARLEIKRGQRDASPPSHGDWPALITEEEFDALHVPGRRRNHGAGRPPTRSRLALYKLARCNKCDGPMYARVSQFERADGSRQRYYHCANRHKGVCDAPRVDAVLVDTGVASHLDKLFIDMEAWQADLAKVTDEHRDRIDRQLRSERAALSRLVSQEEKLRAVWIEAVDADSPKADAREEAFLSVREKRIAAEGSVKAVEQRAAATPAGPPTDETLDLYSELARVVREGDAEDLNDRLRLVFSAFLIETVDGGVLVMPILRDDVVERYADPSGTLRLITDDEVAFVRAPPDTPPNAGIIRVSGEETIRRPPALGVHIGPDASTSATYHQAWLYA